MTIDFLNRLFSKLDREGKLDNINDKTYLKLAYICKTHKILHLKNPKTYNEKLQWLKLNDRNPKYTSIVDKQGLKEYVNNKLGEGHVLETYFIKDKVEEIDFSKLPNEYVLKCTHNSGSIVFCKDNKNDIFYSKSNEKISKQQALEILQNNIKLNYFNYGREWPYKDVKPRIMVEKYLNCGDETLTDYKFFCFNGEPKIMYISKDSDNSPHTDFFDMQFNHLDIKMKDENSKILPQKPNNFEEMIKFARILSKDIPHVRVDMYSHNNIIYIGELTFYHNSGFTNIYPNKWSCILGDWIDLSKAYKYHK